MATAVVAERPERVAPLRSSLPGPSRRIVVEPVEDPTRPAPAPAEPAERPEGEPVPAR
jgi:hypothetical protein